MGKFVYFTSAEKRQANEVDLPSFCVTGAKSSCRLDGSTGWPATTASLYAPTGGMIMLRGGAATPSASCGSSMTRPSRKP